MGRSLLPIFLASCAVLLASCRSTPNPYRPSFVEMARQNAFLHSDAYTKWVQRQNELATAAAPGTGKAPVASRTARTTTVTAARPEPLPNYEHYRYSGLKFSDQLALNYAADKIEVLRPKLALVMSALKGV